MEGKLTVTTRKSPSQGDDVSEELSEFLAVYSTKTAHEARAEKEAGREIS